MKQDSFKDAVRKIVRDKQTEVEEKIERVFELLNQQPDSPESKEEDKEITAYFELIEMIKKEDKNHEYDLPYLQLITLLAEKYVKLKEYRELKKIALDTFELLERKDTPFECLEETIPRIADAIEYSVYNHFLFEILVLFIQQAYKEDKLNEELKPEVKKVLKLNLLLQDNDFPYEIFDKNFTEAITNLFTPKELMDIILHPSLNSLKVDPVEYTWEWEHIFYEVEDKLKELLSDVPRGMGYCFHYWSAKQDLLKNEYNIVWRSPSVMNPRVMFD